MVDLSSFNQNQLASVNWGEGPLLVQAGPGSGKTRVLTHRIARILEDTRGQHFKILGLTFTHKAAAEMHDRIERLIPNSSERTLMTTFHSFGVSLLRQHGHHIGLSPDFAILHQKADQEALLDEAIQIARSEFDEVDFKSEQLLRPVSHLLDNGIDGKDAVEFLKKQNNKRPEEIGAIYRNYRSLMLQNNELDFGGIIAESLGLLRDKPAVRRQVNRVYSYICVDEFQDTNLAQYEILCYLVNPATKNLFVVADDDQIIYQWNGASPERLKKLRSDFAMTVLQLPENYRCPPDVISIANTLIKHNLSHDPEREDLTPRKLSEVKDVVLVKDFPSLDEESDWIASDIAQYPIESRSNIAVLARTRRLLGQICTTLNDHGVPAYLAERKTEFSTNPMVWMHATLRLANARQDKEQLRRVCKSYFDLAGVNLSPNDIMADAATEEGDYLRAWQRAALIREVPGSESGLFLSDALSRLTERLDFRHFINASFDWFAKLPETGPFLEDTTTEYQEELATWHSLMNEIDHEAGGREQVTLNSLLQGLDLRSKSPPPPNGTVSCYTIHGSKGLEFSHVYLAGLVEDQLPSWTAVKKGDDSPEMQEERRNCFVAVTRVQESLTLTYSNKVFGWSKKPSRFLREMGLLPE